MNLADPELELIDPTPNVHMLFLHFDRLFFSAKLSSRAIVRWSKKMYSCAGICSYEGRGGLCDIALSEPLLKLRPRKDLVETLLHEMIHAFLFVTCRDQDRDGHGPNFQAHMHRINKFAGLNISIYHDFHDEVKLYQTHVWRCNGPCQTQRPYFGIVRRTNNRAPGPSDFWWKDHQRRCGGTFIKIKEPEKKTENKSKTIKPNADISKYITKKGKANNNVPKNKEKPKSVLKDSNSIPGKISTKSNSSNTVVVTQKGAAISPKLNSPVTKPIIPFKGKGQTISNVRSRSNSLGVVETVRNVWANKQISTTFVNKKPISPKMPEQNNISNNVNNNLLNRNKHKVDSVHADSPPTKIKKIDDYFKKAETVLKDLYGQEFHVTQSKNDNKLVAKVVTENVALKAELVDCPICNAKVVNNEINRHLDECLNKDVIEVLCKETDMNAVNKQKDIDRRKDVDRKNLKDMVGVIPNIPPFKAKIENNHTNTNNKNDKPFNFKPISSIDIINIEDIIKTDNVRQTLNTAIIKIEKDDTKDTIPSFDSNDINRVKEIAKKIKYEKHVRKSDNFVFPKTEKKDSVDFGNLPSFLDDLAVKIETPPIKIEPGTSKDIPGSSYHKCACCGNEINKPIEEHLEECLAFFVNNETIPEEGASTSFANQTIVIEDDDDIFDESLTFNATGTKSPCPCCLKMVEQANMNDHLDLCLS